MANRYWVGGTGTWDASSTTHWSATTGGASGVSVPGAADAVFFDANSGAGTATLGANATVSSVDFTGYTQTFDFSTFKISCGANGIAVFKAPATTTFSGSRNVEFTYTGAVGTRSINVLNSTEAQAINLTVTAGADTVGLAAGSYVGNFTVTSGFSGILTAGGPTVYGDYTLSSTIASVSANANALAFQSTSATPRTITTAGKTLDNPIQFNGVGGSWVFQDNFVMGSTRAMQLFNGTLNANGKNVTVGTFAFGAGTKTLTLGSGTWTVVGASFNANTNKTGATISASTATINMTGVVPKSFSGGGFVWPTVNQGGSGALTIGQGSTYANLTVTTLPSTISFGINSTNTFIAFSVSGTAGNLLTLNSSSPGTRSTLLSGNAISVSYCSIQDLNATGGSTWSAFTSNGNVDAGNNTGWSFTPSPAPASDQYYIDLRSFTEPKRF